MKRKTKSSFYFVSLISVEDKQKKLPNLACIHHAHMYMVRHTYRPVDGTSYICEVRLGRGKACLRLFIATLFGSYKYYFRPSCFGSCDRQAAKRLYDLGLTHTDIQTVTYLIACMPLLSTICTRTWLKFLYNCCKTEHYILAQTDSRTDIPQRDNPKQLAVFVFLLLVFLTSGLRKIPQHNGKRRKRKERERE